MHATFSLAVNNPRNQEFPGESHEKGFYEVAGTKPLKGVLHSFRGFSVLVSS
jgi:hypothetical protein